MGYTFRPATRVNSKLLIGLYGQSGCGKTYSSLLLARGLVGPAGRIALIDTESGRGQLYADVIPGGYEVLDLGEPFTPARYVEALAAAQAGGFDCVIVDSMSHEWEGIGGVLDMATEIEKRTGKPGLHCWKEPKLQHQKLMLKLLQAPFHVVCCMRAKFKSRQVKNERTGKNEIVKDDHTTPIQADDFIYEMTAHAEVLPDHSIRLTKCSHPDMNLRFPRGKPISVETGASLADWSRGGSEPVTSRIDDPYERGRTIAESGTAALRAWFDKLPRAEKASMKPRLQALKDLAKLADDRAAGEPEPDFDDDAPDPPSGGSGAAPAGETPAQPPVDGTGRASAEPEVIPDDWQQWLAIRQSEAESYSDLADLDAMKADMEPVLTSAADPAPPAVVEAFKVIYLTAAKRITGGRRGR